MFDKFSSNVISAGDLILQPGSNKRNVPGAVPLSISFRKVIAKITWRDWPLPEHFMAEKWPSRDVQFDASVFEQTSIL